MEAKRKYSPSGAAIAEIICSAILVIALFLPWVRVEAAGESKEIALTKQGALAFIYGGVFVFNIILKFFKRSRWLSALTAIVAVLMHTELGADHLNSTPNYYPVHYAPAIGEQIVFMVGLILMAIVLLSWMTSLGSSIVQAYRNKQHFSAYSSSLGLFFLCFIAMLLFGVAFTGSADRFFEDKGNPYLKAVGGFFTVGMIIFVCWGIIGGIIWIIRKIRGTTDEPASQAADEENNIMTKSSSSKPTSRRNLIGGIAVLFLLLLICARYLHTCSSSHPEPEASSVEINEQTDDAPTVETEIAETSKTQGEQYVPFEENGKTGVKDASGKIIIPAEYSGESLYIDEDDDGYISAIESDGDNMMRYFKKTGQMLKHIDFAAGIDVVLFHFADTDTHAFYTKEGQVKASGLSGDIFCLRQVNPQTGYGIRTYYGFRNKDNNDDFMPVYNEDGNRVCTFTINGWQLFGIDHLTRNEDEPRDFEKEFTFTIDLDDFIAAHRSIVH